MNPRISTSGPAILEKLVEHAGLSLRQVTGEEVFRERCVFARCSSRNHGRHCFFTIPNLDSLPVLHSLQNLVEPFLQVGNLSASHDFSVPRSSDIRNAPLTNHPFDHGVTGRERCPLQISAAAE